MDLGSFPLVPIVVTLLFPALQVLRNIIDFAGIIILLFVTCLLAGAVRLTTETSPSDTNPGGNVGRLEIFYNGQWGTVCEDLFDTTDADVVCNQLGYNRADRYGGAVFQFR